MRLSSAPTSFALSGPPNLVQLTWTDTTGGNTAFAIERSSTPDFSEVNAVLFAFPGGQVDNTAPLGTQSYYRIEAINGIGTSAWSQGIAGPAPIPGDVNGDGSVNFSDLLLLAQHYGQSGAFAEGDLNGDGTVGFDDLLILAQGFGKTSPPGPAVPAAAVATHPDSTDQLTLDRIRARTRHERFA